MFPPAAPPAPMTPPIQPTGAEADLPLSPKELKDWRSRIERARRRRKELEPAWQRQLEQYTGRPDGKSLPTGTISTNKSFSQVELKKAQLFYSTPTIALTAQDPIAQSLIKTPGADGKPLTPDQADVAAAEVVLVHETLLNHILGRDGVNAKRVVDKATFDVLCTSAVGFTKIGYQPYVQEIPAPQGVGDVLGLTAPMKIPVYEEFFWTWFSPKKGLIPDDFRDTDYDEAPWLGMEFTKPLNATSRADYGLPDDFKGKASRDEQVFRAEAGGLSTSGDGNSDLIHGIEIWYRPALVGGDEVHPLVQRRLVLIDGLEDRAAKHTASPYQTVQQGRLTPDSMIGFPIHPLTVRDLTDAAYPQSDCAMTEPLINGINKFLQQMDRIRDAAVPPTFYDEGAIPPETIEKWENGEIGALIGIEEGKLTDNIFKTPQRPELGRENFENLAVQERWLDETLSISGVQRGSGNATVKSATEVEQTQQAVGVRLAAERDRVIDWFLKGVSKLDSLVQRFGPMTPIPIQIVGRDGAAKWTQWDKKTIAGRFLYNIQPDSGARVDEAVERDHALKTYEMLRKDPLVNPQTLLRKIAPALRMSPNELIKPAEPPQPEKPNLSYRFGGTDLANPIAVAIMLMTEQISEEDIQAAQKLIQAAGMPVVMPNPTPPTGLESAYAQHVGAPIAPHGGMADKAPHLNKHQADQTGGMQGIG